MTQANREGVAALRWVMGPLNAPLRMPDTQEVVVTEPGRMGVERDGFWSWHDVPELTYDRLEALCILAARMTGKNIGEEAPSVVSRLPDGERIKMLLHPAVPFGTISLSIRRRAAHFVPTLAWLAENDYFDQLDPAIDWRQYFDQAVQDRKSILITGEIGSSKTTLGEALLYAIPPALRVVTVEGAPEWKLTRDNWQPFYFDEADPQAATKRVQDAMQARADWIPFQELRGSEAWALLRALMIGTPTITTVHAESARRGLEPVVLMIQGSPEGAGMDPGRIEGLLRQKFRLIVHCRRFMPQTEGERTRYRIAEVVEVGATAAADRLVSAAPVMESPHV